MPVPPSPRRAVALVAGIGAYRNTRVPTLRYAARDAKALARVLIDPDVCGFPESGVTLLTDREADRDTLVSRLSSWLPKAASGGVDVALIYFAGHGVMHKAGEAEEGFLMPHDADPNDVVTYGVSMADVAKWIGGINARNVVVCLDCCHAGAVLQLPPGASIRGTERNLRLRPSAVERLAGSGRFLLASCGHDQESLELEELKHGLFTYHLLRGLIREGDRDGDGKVSVAELFGYVSSAVSRDATKRGHKQTPWTSATYNEEIILSNVRPKREVSEAPPADADVSIITQLREIRRRPDPARLALLFGAFRHESEAVRGQARRTLKTVGWEWVGRAAEPMAQAADVGPIGAVLEGLAALEARPEVVGLLDRLAGLLHGPPRDRALWLLDRKRLALERERLGQVLEQKHCDYQLERALGPGLYTGAYLAKQRVGGLEVVLRVLRREFAGHPLVRSSFITLGTSAVRLIHPNLAMTREVKIYEDVELYFTVRDYVDGPTLRECLAGGERLGPAAAIKLLRQLLGVLVALHEQEQIHGGVKPSNVFLMRNKPVILGDRSLPLLQSVLGLDMERLAYDFRYVAPELFRGAGKPLLASDTYSLGCVAYELFYGRPPFVADSTFELFASHDRDAVPLTRGDAVDGWLAKLLAKDAAKRPTAQDALEELGAVEESLRRPPEPPAPPKAVEPPKPPEPPPKPPEPPPPVPAPPVAPNPPDLPPAPPKKPVVPAKKVERAEPEDRPATVADMRVDATNASLDRFVPEGRHMESIVPMTNAGMNYTMPDRPSPINSMASSIDSLSGRGEIAGYEILSELGQGGMGVVYKARHVALNREVALKLVRTSGGVAESERARLLTEAASIAMLQHPNIVGIYEVGEHEGMPFMVLEFCAGGSLSRKLNGTPLRPREAAALVGRLADAMQAAHEAGVIHRDLKPANVLLTGDGVPKVTDFGLAKNFDADVGQTRSGAILGTPSYMAPEQARGERGVGPPADTYGLGAILYECLTGRPPFRAESVMETLEQVSDDEVVPPSRLNGRVPRDLETVCLKCLQKEPARRYASAAALEADLTRWLNGEPISARPVGNLERAVKWVRRNPTAAALVAVSAVAVAALGALAAMVLSR